VRDEVGEAERHINAGIWRAEQSAIDVADQRQVDARGRSGPTNAVQPVGGWR
jgi:hypothetical protein